MLSSTPTRPQNATKRSENSEDAQVLDPGDDDYEEQLRARCMPLDGVECCEAEGAEVQGRAAERPDASGAAGHDLRLWGGGPHAWRACAAPPAGAEEQLGHRAGAPVPGRLHGGALAWAPAAPGALLPCRLPPEDLPARPRFEPRRQREFLKDLKSFEAPRVSKSTSWLPAISVRRRIAKCLVWVAWR